MTWVGVNWLPPVGLMTFSVGDTVVVVVVVVVVLDGLTGALPPQAAVRLTIAMIAAPPATAGKRRARRRDLMLESYLYPRLADPGQAGLRQIATGSQGTAIDAVRSRHSDSCAAAYHPVTNRALVN
jgi:hypothetical protein